jgi:tripartite-type tricarboxylate transporter receptor subunit TctC
MDKQILEIIGGNGTIGRGWLAPPDVPADRVAALRSAFAKALADPGAAAEAKKRKMTFGAVSWQDMQAHAARIGAAEDAVFVRVRGLLGVK